jgi:hypothetical protein
MIVVPGVDVCMSRKASTVPQDEIKGALAIPPTVTATLPVVAPGGTGAVMLVALQFVGAATVPLKVTVLVPCIAPKFIPVIVMDVPTLPEVWLRLVMAGAGGVTVKFTPLLASPPTVTATLPVVAVNGTETPILVALQLLGLAAVPLNVTVLVPCVAPKLVPMIVIGVPTVPEAWLRLVMLGARGGGPPAAALNATNTLSNVAVFVYLMEAVIWVCAEERVWDSMPIRSAAPLAGIVYPLPAV